MRNEEIKKSDTIVAPENVKVVRVVSDVGDKPTNGDEGAESEEEGGASCAENENGVVFEFAVSSESGIEEVSDGLLKEKGDIVGTGVAEVAKEIIRGFSVTELEFSNELEDFVGANSGTTLV